jgi:hypothetical protein
MVARRNLLVLLCLATVLGAWAAVDVVTAWDTGLLYLAPALVLCAPLFLGRYVGERRIAELARRVPRRRAQRACASLPLPAGHVRVMQRGGRLVASAMAKRPPPRPARLLTA